MNTMNVFEFSAIVEMNWKANLGQFTDWQPEYTFYADFAIAEFCAEYMRDRNAIKDTYKNVIESWGGNYKALTEIILVLNHKIWAYYGEDRIGVDAEYLGVTKERGNEIAKVYNELWESAKEYFFNRYGEDENAVGYYYRLTD